MTFSPGQRVMCIDDSPHSLGGVEVVGEPLALGAIYTVREVYDAVPRPFGGTGSGVRLNENAILEHDVEHDRIEHWWRSERFRALDDVSEHDEADERQVVPCGA